MITVQCDKACVTLTDERSGRKHSLSVEAAHTPIAEHGYVQCEFELFTCSADALHEAVNAELSKLTQPTRQELAEMLTYLMSMLDNKQFCAYELVEDSFLDEAEAANCLRILDKARATTRNKHIQDLFHTQSWLNVLENAQ